MEKTLPMATKNFIVITSINYPTQALQAFSKFSDWQIIVVADLKTPIDWHLENVKLLTVEEQKQLAFRSSKLMPWNHYTRKNLGYLYAISQGARIIYETDDDNLPYDFWQDLLTNVLGTAVTCNDMPKFINVYKHFSHEHIWPRGFPLDQILISTTAPDTLQKVEVSSSNSPVLQGLADLEPDVDAIYRLTIGKQIKFNQNTPFLIAPGSYCPLNSQNTLWYPEAYPYLFLPASVPSRVTDIWRGYIVQRFLHLENKGVIFHSANVYQERNYHNLNRDFQEEIDLYTKTQKLVNALDGYSGKYSSLMEYLAAHDLVGSQELPIFAAWIQDLQALGIAVS